MIRELWLVRDPLPLDEQGTEVHDTLSTAAGNPRRFDWYGTEPHQSHESPGEIAAFQRRLRDLTIKRIEIQAAQEAEDLRASHEANRLVEQARGKDTGQRSRRSTVRLLREIVLLIALVWMVGLLILTSAGVRVTKLTPAAPATRSTSSSGSRPQSSVLAECSWPPRTCADDVVGFHAQQAVEKALKVSLMPLRGQRRFSQADWRLRTPVGAQRGNA